MGFRGEKELVGKKSIREWEGGEKVWSMEGKGLRGDGVKMGVREGSDSEIVEGVREGSGMVRERVVKGLEKNGNGDEMGGGERRGLMGGGGGGEKKKEK